MKFISIIVILLASASCSSPKKSPKMTERTEALCKNLYTIAEKGVMFGHQDDTFYGVNWKYETGRSDVRDVCGKYPAVYGYELGDIELGRDKNLDEVPFDLMRQHIKEAYERGAINTISWHANNPITGGNAWDTSDSTVVRRILQDSATNKMFKTWLDKLASFMLSLRSDDGELIPILFRPYHEHTGRWFWWGAGSSSAKDYIELWHFTADYLRTERGVNNMIYVYSPDYVLSEEHYMECYPGDDYVDVLGIDAYHKEAAFGELLPKQLSIMTKIANDRQKPAVISETGYEGVSDPSWWTNVLLPAMKEYKVAYVLLWRNAHDRPGHYFAPYPGQVSEQDFIKFEQDEKTLFESDINEMYK